MAVRNSTGKTGRAPNRAKQPLPSAVSPELQKYVRDAFEDLDNARKAIELARIQAAKFDGAECVVEVLKIAYGECDAADNDVDLIREELGLPFERDPSAQPRLAEVFHG